MAATLTNKPTLIYVEKYGLKFLIFDTPSERNVHLYIKEFQKHNVKHVVRVCQATYPKEIVERSQITFHVSRSVFFPALFCAQKKRIVIHTTVFFSLIKKQDWGFDDGSSPPQHVLKNWIDLVNETFPVNGGGSGSSSNDTSSQSVDNTPAIAVHCVAGLGRAPVLVAVALVERANMEALDAITFIRARRRGAINATQMQFIEKYYKQKKKGKCLIM